MLTITSGKSSLILLLLRLLDPTSPCRECITIDDTPLHKVDRSTLRDRFITIPQEPAFLPDGTSFQSNLDPYSISDEQECQLVFETVNLWTSVQRQGGLQAPLFKNSLSQGQKQLFSLARAVLKCRVRTNDQKLVGVGSSGGVLLVDEVSSNVDSDTEKVMIEVMKREFESYTVIMVSHRLEIVRDFDTLVVMNKGSVVETGKPEELMGRAGGVFRNSI